MFSIIIPAYIIDDSCIEMTETCTKFVKKYTKVPHEIIIVRSYPYDRKTYTQAVNEGINKATGNYIVVLNNDVEVAQDWIESMIECFVLPGCGVATLNAYEHDIPKHDSIVEDFYGPCWMVSRKVLDKVGLLDERFVNSFEDADYWVRVYQAGYKILRNLNCIITHKERATCKKIIGDNQDSIKNKELFISKYGELDLPIYKKLRG